jgi:hypothetical protein
MAITIVGTVTAAEATTTSHSKVVPAGCLPGDLLLFATVNRDATTAPTVSDDDTGGNSWTRKGSETSRGHLYYKRATSGTANKTVTASGNTGSTTGVLLVLRGCIETGDPFDAYSLEENISGNETHAAISTTVANALVGHIVYNYSNDTLAPGNRTATSPATITELGESTSTGGNDCSVSMAADLKAATGSTGAITWAQTDGASVSIAFAIKPDTTVDTATVFKDYRFSNDASDLTGETQNKSLEASGATTGSWAGQNLAANATVIGSYFTPPGEPGTDGVSGKTLPVWLTVSSGNTNLRYWARLHRVNSSGTIQASSAAVESSTGSASSHLLNCPTTNLGTWASGDRLRVDIGIRNTVAVGSQSCTIDYGTSSSTTIGRLSSVLAPWNNVTNTKVIGYASHHTDLTVSNSDRTVTKNVLGAAAYRGAQGTPRQFTGKVYFEGTFTELNNTADTGIGILTSAVTGGASHLANWLGSSSLGASLGWYPDGKVWFNNALLTTIQTYTELDTLCVAVDFTNNRIWFRTNGGNWNNSGTANPATNTGGLDISTRDTTTGFHPAVNLRIDSDSFTFNLGSTVYQQTVPSGFTNWDGTTPSADQTLQPSLFNDGTDTFYAHTVVATYTLNPSLFNDGTDTFYAHTITTFNQLVQGAILTDGDTFFSHTITTSYTITPSLYSDSDTFYTHVVFHNNVTLQPALFTDGDTFHTATLTLYLVPSLFANTNTFHNATVVATYTLSPSLFDDSTDTFYGPTVSATYTLLPSLYSDSDVFYSPTVEGGAGEGQTLVQDAILSDGDTFFSHTVTTTYTITPNLFDESTDTFYTHTVFHDNQTLLPSLFVDGDTFHQALLTLTLFPSLFSDGDTFHNATVVATYTLSPSHFDDSTDTFHSPTVTATYTLLPSLYADPDIFYPPTIPEGEAPSGEINPRIRLGRNTGVGV